MASFGLSASVVGEGKRFLTVKQCVVWNVTKDLQLARGLVRLKEICSFVLGKDRPFFSILLWCTVNSGCSYKRETKCHIRLGSFDGNQRKQYQIDRPYVVIRSEYPKDLVCLNKGLVPEWLIWLLGVATSLNNCYYEVVCNSKNIVIIISEIRP
jgi:hypothetical protein